MIAAVSHFNARSMVNMTSSVGFRSRRSVPLIYVRCRPETPAPLSWLLWQADHHRAVPPKLGHDVVALRKLGRIGPRQPPLDLGGVEPPRRGTIRPRDRSARSAPPPASVLIRRTGLRLGTSTAATRRSARELLRPSPVPGVRPGLNAITRNGRACPTGEAASARAVSRLQSLDAA